MTNHLIARCCLVPFLGSLILHSAVGGAETQPLELHPVHVDINSYRLLAMSMDQHGSIWAGSIHRVIHRYDPRNGRVVTVPLPYDAVACSCNCVGDKVYVLGQAYPRLIIYDQRAKSFAEAEYPSPDPDVWYGTEPVDGRHFYLFDRGSGGVIQWDSQSDTGKVIPWPYQSPLPSGGRIEPRDKALWCMVWDVTSGQYVPIGIARLDLGIGAFTGWFPFPQDDAGLEPMSDPSTTFFLPYTLKGKLVPFDFKHNRWCQFLPVPGHGQVFGFIGGAVMHKGRWYFSLSTYNGTETGCDGQPYHFCNAILEFEPQAGTFELLTLAADEDSYYQLAYTLSAGGEFFATGSNIREPDGTLNRDRKGEVVFWQTVRPN